MTFQTFHETYFGMVINRDKLEVCMSSSFGEGQTARRYICTYKTALRFMYKIFVLKALSLRTLFLFQRG